jgi:hypothetical protein
MFVKALTVVITGLITTNVLLLTGCTTAPNTAEVNVAKELKGKVTRISNVNGRFIAEVVDDSGNTVSVDITEDKGFNTKFFAAIGAYCMSPAGYLPCSIAVGLIVSIVWDGTKWVVRRVWG